MNELRDIWAYLSASPLLHLFLTLAAFKIGLVLHERGGRSPFLNPVLLAVVILVSLLLATGTSYADYFAGAQFIHFLLGPATVALAVPLYKQFDRVRRSALAIGASLLIGCTVAILSAALLGDLLGAARDAQIALAAKSTTAPVAMGVSERLGGLPSLTAVLVIATGIFGAAFGPLLLRLVRVKDPRAQGVAIGVASHGIGAARALEISPTTGAFAGLAMGLNALATALLLPLIWGLL